ncbi:homoserine kinase [Trueperella pecoris]|uniref:Homoserine kinase n=1 Tax=Trueperella pecoris TaxID=2733571 RepID=A0A7M1QW75_9ACTO|nr:homoserine kinase [Trueperella pecoris]QOR46116.1 homoserine kinase [Trueperella pecoris]QTG75940.1 homoserine kinase [Trueperella pecoris]
MRIVNDSARVRVPASSGNLGPGFDSMGMAHDVWDEVSATLTTGASKALIVGEGHDTLPKDGSHLIIRVMRETLERLGLPAAGVELVCRNSIPHGKGLGSSAAAIVAGVMLVRQLVGSPEEFTDEEVLNIASEYEGHPDNAAPAIYGGTTLSWAEGKGYRTVRLTVSPKVKTTLLVPSEILPTTTARAVLPASVPHTDAAFNAGRTALLTHALANAPSLLFAATQDKLHQDYRSEAMPHTAAVLGALRKAGWPAVVSGAGPSILLFAEVDPAMANIFAQQGYRTMNSRQVRGAHIAG